jgi:hypothetical protein
MGCVTEIVAHTPRIFVPVGAHEVLAKVLESYPVVEISAA